MRRTIWRGALLLTGAAMLVKVMSAAYRIPYQNLTGDLGFYVYGQIYPFYGLAVILATYGFPAAISRIVSEYAEEGKDGVAGRLFVQFFLALTLLCAAVFGFLYFGTPFISDWMGDEKLTVPLRMISYSFLFLPAVASIRGYFQGYHRMGPTAGSQLIEQFVRVTAILALTYYLVVHGYGAYAAGTAAAAGSSAGMAAAAVILVLYSFKNRIRLKNPFKMERTYSFIKLLKKLSVEGLAFSVSSLVIVIFLFIDALTAVRFMDGGLNAKQLKGIYDRGFPLIQLGTAAAIAFSLALVPAVSGAKARGDAAQIKKNTALAMKISAVFGLGAATGLAVLAEPVNIMLYENDAGTGVLAVLGFTTLFSSLAITSAGILQALGYVSRPVGHALYGLAVKTAVNCWLIPLWDMTGAAISTVAGFSVIAILNIVFLNKKVGGFSWIHRCKYSIGGSLIVMALAVGLWRAVAEAIFHPDGSRWIQSFIALGGTLTGLAVYAALLMILRVFRVEELKKLGQKKRDRYDEYNQQRKEG